jgi:hypothetical protein
VGLRAGLGTVEKTENLPLPRIDLWFIGHSAYNAVVILTLLTCCVVSRARYRMQRAWFAIMSLGYKVRVAIGYIHHDTFPLSTAEALKRIV